MTKQQTIPKEATFHKVRGEIIDLFARLEASLAQQIAKSGNPVKADSMASKLKFILQLDSTPDAAKSELKRLSELIPIRHDLVHGTMATVDYHGSLFACFRNARFAAEKVQPATLISFAELNEMRKELGALAGQLEED